MKFQLLMDSLDEEPEVHITYFKPDDRKAGGAYLTASGTVKKIDDFERIILWRTEPKYRWTMFCPSSCQRKEVYWNDLATERQRQFCDPRTG